MAPALQASVKTKTTDMKVFRKRKALQKWKGFLLLQDHQRNLGSSVGDS